MYNLIATATTTDATAYWNEMVELLFGLQAYVAIFMQ